MNKEVKKAIKTLKTFLGMETKLEDMPLADGMTTIQADMFEVGEAVFIVVENADPVPLPIGEYELADGRILTVEVEGVIAKIEDAMPTEENPAEAKTEVPVEAEKVAQQTTAKKIIKSTVEEQHFSKLEAKITELENKILELSKVKEVVTEVVEEVIELTEVKAIKFNPENKSKNDTPLTPLERFRAIKERMNNN
jgi:hypothetical protein